jgi:hypothetical protein
MILSIREAAHRLDATPDEVIDAAGLTLGELEHAAQQCGFFPERYHEAPILDETTVASLVGRITNNRLSLF